jgi:hypothetical protein
VSEEKGFMEDINSGFEYGKKSYRESEVAASAPKYSEEDTTSRCCCLNGNEAIKINISVLATDFDFSM